MISLRKKSLKLISYFEKTEKKISRKKRKSRKIWIGKCILQKRKRRT
jgi:hypothetical protein